MHDITMPALSPTMEVGTLARWLKKEGDAVKPGDVIAEIETDKATMEIEAIDDGILTRIVVPDGTEGVKVGAVIAVIAGEGEESSAPPSAPLPGAASERNKALPPSGGGLGEGGEAAGEPASSPPAPGGGEVAAATLPPAVGGYGANPAEDAAIAGAKRNGHAAPATGSAGLPPRSGEDRAARILASPLARRLAELRNLDLGRLTGTGPGGRIVKADVDAALPLPGASAPVPLPRAGEGKPSTTPAPAPIPLPPAGEGMRAQASEGEGSPAPKPAPAPDIPHEAIKLSNMRKVIARRLTESKQTIPHYYLAIDCRLDALLKLRAELNAAQSVKLSVNDLLIKALAVALREVPDANVSYTGDSLLKFSRADISVAVAIPAGLITPVITNADGRRLSDIATAMKELAARAKDGKLQPHEYQGGTASLSNLGMYGIKQFEAVINPPQGMILAVGAGDRRPWIEGDQLTVATVLTATGSFDHRAIDGAVGAELMAAFKRLLEAPLSMLA